MSDEIIRRRIIDKRSNIPGETATKPLTPNHRDGQWRATDIYEGEFFYNIPDKKLYTRSGDDIVEITNNSPGGGIPEPTQDGINARSKNGANFSWVQLADDIVNFTDENIGRLLDLVFEALTTSGSASPSTFERGVATNVTFNYSIDTNDDTITQIVWDGNTITTPPFPTTGSASEIGATNTVSRTLEVDIQRSATIPDLVLTSRALIPQWRGVSALDTLDGTYTQLNTELNKVVQNGDNQTFVFVLSNSYAWFVSTNNNATILDGNGFNQSISALDDQDGVSEFYRSTFTATLADGTTTTLYTYRTRLVKNTTITYQLS